jgi:nitrogen regulatory protein PII-like uncharacterized protein
MSKKTKIKTVKRILKISIAATVAIVLVVLGFFVKHNYTFENASMDKWSDLTSEQQIATLNRVVSDYTDQELLLQCVSKIAQISDSGKMDIRDAIVICYNGIKIAQDEK